MRYIIILLVLTGINAGAQTLVLGRGTDSHTIVPDEEISVFSEIKGLRNDSLELMARGKLLEYKNDTVYLATDEYVRHDYYRTGSDSLHYMESLLDSMVYMKFPAREVTGIYHHRTRLKKTSNRIVFITLGTSLATMPLVLALKPGTVRDVITVTNLTSTLTMFGAATVGIVFSKWKFRIRPANEKSWVIK